MGLATGSLILGMTITILVVCIVLTAIGIVLLTVSRGRRAFRITGSILAFGGGLLVLAFGVTLTGILLFAD